MIRKLKESDINRVMDIWLNGNIEAHSFINTEHWKSHFDMAKEGILSAEVYLYEENNVIKGFIGITENYIAGIFIANNFRSKGIGRALIDYVKSIKKELTLNVFMKNERAIKFYLSNGFKIVNEEVECETGEDEYTMKWYLYGNYNNQ